MTISGWRRTVLLLLFGLPAGSAACSAQINIAALAQFKQNQQAALAKQLQGKAATAQPAGKHGKGKAAAPMIVAKPPIIHAQNRTFKGNYTDMRKSNMR